MELLFAIYRDKNYEQEGTMAKVGYVRVSTEDQNLHRQEDALRALNVERVFSDKISGGTTARPGLQAMLDFVREGDVLYVESISRLARSTRDLLSIIETLELRGVAFVSSKENIDTSTPQGRFVMTLFAAMAELEKATILQRQKEGIQSAKARGRRLGRPKAEFPAEWESVYSAWKSEKVTASAAMKALGLHKTTFYMLRKKWESSRGERFAS
jgi:DNA invertase Pin-like site-specific DNA recombinase